LFHSSRTAGGVGHYLLCQRRVYTLTTAEHSTSPVLLPAVSMVWRPTLRASRIGLAGFDDGVVIGASCPNHGSVQIRQAPTCRLGGFPPRPIRKSATVHWAGTGEDSRLQTGSSMIPTRPSLPRSIHTRVSLYPSACLPPFDRSERGIRSASSASSSCTGRTHPSGPASAKRPDCTCRVVLHAQKRKLYARWTPRVGTDLAVAVSGSSRDFAQLLPCLIANRLCFCSMPKVKRSGF
jgi:hypothetical protein